MTDAADFSLKTKEMAKQLVEDLGFTGILKSRLQRSGAKSDDVLNAYKEAFDKALTIIQGQ